VGAAQPQVVVAGLIVSGGGRGCGKLALVDGGVGLVLRVEDAAQQLPCGGVGGIGGECGAQQGGGVVDPALLQGVVGGRVFGQRVVESCGVRDGRLGPDCVGEDLAGEEEAENDRMRKQ